MKNKTISTQFQIVNPIVTKCAVSRLPLFKQITDRRILLLLGTIAVFFGPWASSGFRLPLQIKINEGMILLFLCLGIVCVLMRGKVYLPPGSFFLFCLIGVSLVSLWSSPPPEKTEFRWAHGVYQPGLYNLTIVARQGFYLLFYVGIVNICKNKHSVIRLLKWFVLGGVIAAIFGLVQATLFLLGKSTWGLYITTWDPVPRILGTFNEPGPFSDYLALVAILLFASILFGVHLFSKNVSYIFLFIIGLALILSFSSRGTLEALLGTGYLLLSAPNRLKVLVKISVIGCIIVFASAAFCPRGFIGLKWVFSKVISEAKLDPAKAYDGGRTGGLHIAPRIFLRYPMLGAGIGNYPFFRNKFATEAGLPQVSHLDLANNVFLEFLAETGIVGFTFLVSFWMSIFLYVYRNYRLLRTTGDGNLIHGLVAVSLMVLFGLTFTSSFYFIHVWFLLALLVAYVRISKKIPNQAY